MANLITRLGWESRLASYPSPGNGDARSGAPLERPGATPEKTAARLQQAAADLVDYMLFVYEAPLPDKIRGSSGFAELFSGLGPADDKGRSLRQLDLDRRLMRYPCSYMIYSAAFDGLPEPAKNLVYRRLWQVLAGQDKDPRYARLSAADRHAIIEILRSTKKELPDYFQ
jgi:hypothetical protein